MYRKETLAEVVLDTVYFKDKFITIPVVIEADIVVQVEKEFSQTLEKTNCLHCQQQMGDALRNWWQFMMTSHKRNFQIF